MLLCDETIYKKYFDGTHRGELPEKTLERITKFCPAFGITRIANITGLDSIGIPVILVTQPNARSLAVSQGKGTSVAAAKVSGVMEAIESYHAERINLPTRILSHDDMCFTFNLIDITNVGRRRSKTLEPATRIPWVKGYDLLHEKELWIPFELIHTDYTCPVPHDHGYFVTDTNGLASGNSLLEAAIHGICEVIERDALATWQLRGEEWKDRNRIDLDSVVDPECRYILDKFADANVVVGVWDIGNDVGVPSYECKIIEGKNNQAKIRPASGSGTHLCKGVALSRALTEAAQSRLTFISGARDDQYKDVYEQQQSQEMHCQWLEEINRGNGGKEFSKSPGFEASTLNEDYEYLLSRLKAVGVEQVGCVDLTREEFNISVVKVVIPQLEGITLPEDKVPGERFCRLMRGGLSSEK